MTRSAGSIMLMILVLGVVLLNRRCSRHEKSCHTGICKLQFCGAAQQQRAVYCLYDLCSLDLCDRLLLKDKWTQLFESALPFVCPLEARWTTTTTTTTTTRSIECESTAEPSERTYARRRQVRVRTFAEGCPRSASGLCEGPIVQGGKRGRGRARKEPIEQADERTNERMGERRAQRERERNGLASESAP